MEREEEGTRDRRAPLNSTETTRAAEDRLEAALAAAGDASAFERLYRAHVARVYTLASRFLGDAEAPAATQDVFVRAWQKLDGFRGDAAFGTWLHRLAVNHLLNERRRRGRRREREVDVPLERLPGERESPEQRITLERALRELPDGAREVFVLFDVEGYSHAEIAERMGVSEGTSKSQLHRARMLLRERLLR